MRKSTLLIVLGGIAFVTAICVSVLWPRSEQITMYNCGRIKIRMSRDTVESILGPPGDYRTQDVTYGDLGYGPRSMMAIKDGERTTREVWKSDTICIYVSYNADGLVWDRDFRVARAVKQSQFDRLKWYVHHRWPNLFQGD